MAFVYLHRKEGFFNILKVNVEVPIVLEFVTQLLDFFTEIKSVTVIINTVKSISKVSV